MDTLGGIILSENVNKQDLPRPDQDQKDFQKHLSKRTISYYHGIYTYFLTTNVLINIGECKN